MSVGQKMADIGVKNMKKCHPADCLFAWLKFKGLQSVSIQSRDGCCSLLIQPGVPLVQSFLFVLNGQSPIALSPVGNRQEKPFLSFRFQVSFNQNCNKSLLPFDFFITVILKVFSDCLNGSLPIFLVYFYHFS